MSAGCDASPKKRPRVVSGAADAAGSNLGIVMAKRAGKVPEHLRDLISLQVRPNNWLTKARKLRKATDVLFISFENDQAEFDRELERNSFPEMSYPDDSIITMLLGFAIENLLKGLYVSTGNVTNIKNLSELDDMVQSHQLESLAVALGESKLIEFSPEEIQLFNALERVVIWRGRYPSPQSINHIFPADDSGQFKTLIHLSERSYCISEPL